ncbi:DUF1569 domain-containing protein [Galbibacter pacificus]|uniref:DUF1569 domain-containing protein n=1 Tax=Galbibacter pacificus TaxID=2996052 RepID=A0ABT6FML6_9FLAO|nr:DUF1569 domain-containing protein [Galbibacter pacificus]MDG3580853.1 DUF1569 domain-containing protein [Galbibacter pacificus]MDG3584331.1 DUF1569 domain-containing protein [Galbibacter pacificus]
MKSIFSEEVYHETLSRIKQLTTTSKAEWGSMDVSQMLHHCQKPMEVAMGKLAVKTNFFFKWASRLFKPMLYNDKPWKHGLPTVKEFIVENPKNFEQEKEKLIGLIAEYHQLKTKNELPPHPVFGKFTKQQWGQMQYKHLDHHLRQFGV